MFLETIVRRQEELQKKVRATLPKVIFRRLDPHDAEAKTLGLKLPADVRRRIKALSTKLDEKAYKQLTFACIMAGLEVLERWEPASDE